MQYHVDTHVHVYHCYEANAFLSRAVSNSRMMNPHATLILCLTESRGFDFFQELKTRAVDNNPIYGWSASMIVGQPAIALNQADQNLIIIAGRQIITKQGLEVLALFNDLHYDDGLDIQAVIDKINENKGVAVLPWGVGKWLGKRGAVITGLLSANKPERLAIADISTRPALWPEPAQFRLARHAGYACLYGTDPLPLHNDQYRIASAGMRLELSTDPSQAVAELKTRLYRIKSKDKCGNNDENYFGGRVSVPHFFKDQLMLRFYRQSCLTEQVKADE